MPRLAALSANGRGAVWMLLAVLAFSGNNISLKALGRELDPIQIMLVRSALMAALILPFCWATGAIGTARIGAHFTRATLGTAGAYLFVLALTLAPLADVIATSFSRALFIVVLAAAVLGEAVRWRRWTAVILGFAGVLVMVRPGLAELNWGLVAAMADAFFSAGVALTLRSLGRTERAQTVVFYFGLFSVLYCAVPAALVWRDPSAHAWLLLALTGVLATLGQIANTRAWVEGEASIVAPLAYVQLVLSGALDFLFFGAVPDRFTMMGAAMIVAATLYIALREARLRLGNPSPPSKRA